MREPRLSLLHRSFIVPSTPSPQKFVFLSAFDIMCHIAPYNCRILFFRISPEDYPSVITKLKLSLSTVLAHFYPFAGRLAEGENGRLQIVCNDLGAEFVEAVMDGVALGDLEANNFQMKPYFVEFTRGPDYPPGRGTSAPLLSVQLTRLRCGSVALGVAHSHVVADGSSLWHFMKSWAECGRGESISVRPVHERELLKVEKPSEEEAGIDMEEIEDEVEEAQKTQRVFVFTKEMIGRLKEACAGGGFTSYEVLVSHVWRCASRARSHAPDKKLGFIHVANMRSRMLPPLPHGYFGNSLLWAMATATARELQEETLDATARRMQGALASCTSSAVHRLLHSLELHGHTGLFARASLNRARMRVSSSPRFPVFDTDFGWGKPLSVRTSQVEEQGKIVFFPTRDGNSTEVCLALPMATMCRLECDAAFIHNLLSPH